MKEATWLPRLLRDKAMSVIVGLLTAGICTTLWGVIQHYQHDSQPQAVMTTTTSTSIPVAVPPPAPSSAHLP